MVTRRPFWSPPLSLVMARLRNPPLLCCAPPSLPPALSCSPAHRRPWSRAPCSRAPGPGLAGRSAHSDDSGSLHQVVCYFGCLSTSPGGRGTGAFCPRWSRDESMHAAIGGPPLALPNHHRSDRSIRGGLPAEGHPRLPPRSPAVPASSSCSPCKCGYHACQQLPGSNGGPWSVRCSAG